MFILFNYTSRFIILIAVLLAFLISSANAQFTSDIIFMEDGRLTYISDEESNRIPDYSHAGYKGGGVALPEVPVVITLDPQDGDDTFRIQQALNEAGALQMDENGIRGAVKLNAGTYRISSTLTIGNSGVVLRGAGDEDDPESNTIIIATQNIRSTVLQLRGGSVNWNRSQDKYLTFIDSEFIPVGSRVFEVEDASGFEVGDNVIIRHNATQAWIDAIDGGGTANDPYGPWTPGTSGIDIYYNRYITEISGNTIAIDAPVFNHLDRNLSRSVIFQANRNNLITEVGVEDFRIVIETDGEFTENHARNGILFDGVENGWARGVTVMHFIRTGIGTTNSTHITIRDSRALEPHSIVEAVKRYNFNVLQRSNNILFESVTSSESRHDFISDGTASASGLVFTNSTAYRTRGPSEGHRRWGQGILFDKLTFENIRTDYILLGHYNRGSGGTAHGWASVHGVAWNIFAAQGDIIIEKPPTAQNYGIGLRGGARIRNTGPYQQPGGYFEGNDEVPEFESLYEIQLDQRLEFGVPPDAPARLTAFPDENEENMELSWLHSSVTNSEFIIERSDDDGRTFHVIATLAPGTTSYTDEGITMEQYVYRVRASDNTGKSAWSNPVPFYLGITEFQQTAPFSGASRTLTNSDSRSLDFRWTQAHSGYDLSYTWFLYPADGDPEDAYVVVDADDNVLVFTHKELDDKLAEAGIRSGESINARWRVKAHTSHREMWADEPSNITVTRSGTLTYINKDNEIPQEFNLRQNYPNPFNPVTQISYDLPVKAHVRLEVFNALGQTVATLVNEYKSPGTHHESFDASGLSSGVYLYRLQAGAHIITNKMVLMK
jgi:hypothetical protein